MTKILWVAAAALVDAEDRVLLARRPEGKNMAGMWEYPGGKIEEGETPEQAVCRELEEELKIGVCPVYCLPLVFASHPYRQFHLVMPLFLCRRWTGDPIPAEGQRIAWTPGRTVGLDPEKYPMPNADGLLSERLRQFLTY